MPMAKNNIKLQQDKQNLLSLENREQEFKQRPFKWY